MSKDKEDKEKKLKPHEYDLIQPKKLGIPMRLYRLVISGIRRTFSKANLKSPTWNKNKVKRGVYKCELCDFTGPRKDFQIDHIKPLISVECNDDWDGIIQRTFDIDNLQMLCPTCHTAKTKQENSLRAKNRRLKKKKLKEKENERNKKSKAKKSDKRP